MKVFEATLVRLAAHHGVLSGTLARVTDGQDIPKRFFVYVYAEHGHLPGHVAPARLDPVASVRPAPDGNWSVTNLDAGKYYTAISYDPTGEDAPAIQAGLIPSVD